LDAQVEMELTRGRRLDEVDEGVSSEEAAETASLFMGASGDDKEDDSV
jgi:hypothetical protein